MKTSESIAEIAKALSAAQGEFPAVEKNATNPHFRSTFADLAAIIGGPKDILAKHGLSVVQLPDWDGENDLLTTRIMHASGEWIEAPMRLFLTKEDPQGQGSALTYARRYSRSAALGLATEDDDGNAASSGVPAGPATTRRSAPRRPQNGPGAPPPASEPNGSGEAADGLSAKDRNRIIAHLSRLDPPVRGDASVNAHLTAILNLPEPLAGVGDLTAEQGAQVVEFLGIAP